MKKWIVWALVMLLTACSQQSETVTNEKETAALAQANRIRVLLNGLRPRFDQFMQGEALTEEKQASWDEKTLEALAIGKEIFAAKNQYERCGDAAFYGKSLNDIMRDGSTLGQPDEYDKEVYQSFKSALQACKDVIKTEEQKLVKK